jgi:hypothetical protein
MLSHEKTRVLDEPSVDLSHDGIALVLQRHPLLEEYTLLFRNFIGISTIWKGYVS